MKSAEQKRTRRRRYIDAIEPFRQQFSCSAAQVHGVINGILSENKSLKGKLSEAENKIKEQEEELVKAQTLINSLSLELEELKEKQIPLSSEDSLQ